MRRLLQFLVVVSLVLSVFPSPIAVLAAPGDITVVSSTHQNRFPNDVAFRLEAKSSFEIKKVILYYRTKDAAALSYAYPTFTPGTSVSAEHSLNTRQAYVPPSSEFSYQWLIEDSAGNSLRTEFTTFDMDDSRFTWNKQTKDGVTMYWYKGSQSFIDGLHEAASAAIKRLSSEIGITYERPVRIVVYDSKADMDPALPKRSDTYSRETITLGVRLSADVLALLANQADVKETLAHELSHMVVHQMVDNPYGDIPAWLDEGLSMVAEGELPSGFRRALEDGIRRDSLLSVRSMTSYSGDPAKVNLFYAESQSVTKYLLDTYGREKMVQLLKTFKEGNTTDDALRSVYGFTMDELDAKWRTSLGLPSRPSGTQASPTDATPVPTLIPFGFPGGDSSGRSLVSLLWACIALVLCTLILLLIVVAFVLYWVRRRR